ncbi:MAG TPA: alpha-2-macroglobulin family protein [Opitutaceae bacterium]|nr:alpha-2-macroglobulin family protein [Opitutaceae bacterium]
MVDPSASNFALKVPNHVSAESWSLQPGQTFTALWGTGYSQGRAFVEVERDGRTLQSYWTRDGGNQETIRVPVTEALRGGFLVKITSIRENRAYFHTRIVEVPWKNKELNVTWESFRSKLTPGQKETWTAVVKGPDTQRAVAEVVAALYDASLDQFKPHRWPQAVANFRQEVIHATPAFANALKQLTTISHWEKLRRNQIQWSYPNLHSDLRDTILGNQVVELLSFYTESVASGRPALHNIAAGQITELSVGEISADSRGFDNKTSQTPINSPYLDQIHARRNLTETAFFFPQLVSSSNGEVRLEFTMPEALTEWRMLGFAHDKSLRSGFFTGKAITSKDLMVEPNPPRFIREGDELEFTVKVSNQTALTQTGKVRLTFSDAFTFQTVDEALSNRITEQAFELPANQSRSYAWRIKIPDEQGPIVFKAVASTAVLSDGEEAMLPILSRRVLITESLPLPIRGKTEKAFDFTKLSQSSASPTLRHQSLTVQMTSQPAWYAVMALPYLMEFPYECSEQIFNRYYANALASHIATSDPKIQRVFDLWKNTPAVDSPLEKNQELKSLLIEETPWLRRAKKDSEARRTIGVLFEHNRLERELARALDQLTRQQLPSGFWPWFSGGPESPFVSLYVTTGFGRLRHRGVKADTTAALKSLIALDTWFTEKIKSVQQLPIADDYTPSYLDSFYLYGRSFFLNDVAVSPELRSAIDFVLGQARKNWTKLDSQQSHAHLALGLMRFGDKATARAIAKSLTERAVRSEEMGMHWPQSNERWWWYRAPIETQTMMIEVFAEVTNDKKAVEDCQVWLLKQKQTQNWSTTKATADAIYALLMRGSSILSSDALVQVSLGGETVRPETVEAGSGFYQKTYAGSEVSSDMGQIVVKKTDAGVSWGGIHWQYLERIDKVTPHTDTPLTLRKMLFVRENTSRGPELKPVTGPLRVGDELVVRLELRVDRDMEYLHLKDQRGSGTEPVNVLSEYKYQDRLSYYESTRDTATHFFLERLNRGTYVFEYPVRIQLRGTYQSGIAEIQSMYAPEFNSHSESIALIERRDLSTAAKELQGSNQARPPSFFGNVFFYQGHRIKSLRGTSRLFPVTCSCNARSASNKVSA